MLDSTADQIGPSIIVAFEELSFLVQESNTALLVFLTTATVTRPFHVEVHPMEGTATGTYVLVITCLRGMLPRACSARGGSVHKPQHTD